MWGLVHILLSVKARDRKATTRCGDVPKEIHIAPCCPSLVSRQIPYWATETHSNWRVRGGKNVAICGNILSRTRIWPKIELTGYLPGRAAVSISRETDRVTRGDGLGAV